MPADLPGILQSFDGTDTDGDAIAEIIRLRLAGASATMPEPARGRGLTLVLVEARLLAPAAGPALLPRLDRLVADIAAEQGAARLVAADLYQGPVHNDGAIIVALRRVFRVLREQYGLRHVVLVGRFPEAQLVRRWPWAPAFGRTIGGIAVPEGWNYFAYEPERVASSADIVLADLNGAWDDLYRRHVAITSVHIRPDRRETAEEILAPGRVIAGRAAQLETLRFEDVFWIDDGDVDFPSRSPVTARIRRFRADPEVPAGARRLPNPIAVPELFVSRINAFHAATRLPTDRSVVTSTTGRLVDGSPVDAGGRPQAFTSTVNYATTSSDPEGRVWTIDPREFEPDPGLERRLLAEYLDRNHRWRTGGYPPCSSAVGVAYDGPNVNGFTGEDTTALAASAWPGAVEHALDDASLAAYARSWCTAATVRSLLAHSDEQISLYGPSSPAALVAAMGDRPWRWMQTEPHPGRSPREFRYVPTYAGTASGGLPGGGPSAAAGAWLHRTLWQEGRVADPPSVVLHGGCGASGPVGAYDTPYTGADYGTAQNCESILFFARALAVVGRSKVFNDTPVQFAEALAEDGVTLGEAWRHLFSDQALQPPLGNDGPEGGNAGAKQAYPWNLLGDATLRLRPRRR